MNVPQWVPEVRHFCPGVPIILVCCKIDLRDDAKVVTELRKSGQEPVSRAQGLQMAKKINAVKYIECSALKGTNVRVRTAGDLGKLRALPCFPGISFSNTQPWKTLLARCCAWHYTPAASNHLINASCHLGRLVLATAARLCCLINIRRCACARRTGDGQL